MIKAVIFDMFETLVTHYESPLYMGKQIALDLGIEEQKFREIWDATEVRRTLGEKTIEEVIEEVLRVDGCYAEEAFEKVIARRKQSKIECFEHIHPEIIPLFQRLKEWGMKKPEMEIFKKCLEGLKVRPEECLYVGDGGNFELEAAQSLGMHPIQAAWYFKDGVIPPSKRKVAFLQAETPMEVLDELKNKLKGIER